MFSFKDVLVAMENLKRKNTATGASKAAALAGTFFVQASHMRQM